MERRERSAGWLVALLAVASAASAGGGPSGNGCLPVPGEAVLPSDRPVSSVFGRSAAMRGDRLIVGDCGDEDPLVPFDVGRAYLLERVGEAWIEAAAFRAPDLPAPARYGWSVAVEGDWAAVTAPWLRLQSGEVFLYRRTIGPGGDVEWVWAGNIKPDHVETPFRFGYAAAMEGGVLAIAGIRNNAYPNGWVELYGRINGDWRLLDTVGPPDGREGDAFGVSVSLSNGRLLVGAPLHVSPLSGEGAAYLFRKIESGWVFERKFVEPGLPDRSRYGWRVSIDRGTAVVGSPESAGDSPKVWVYRLAGDDWLPDGAIRRPPDNDPVESDFGRSVAVSGDALAVGAPFAQVRGAAYFYRRIDGAWVPKGRVRFDDASNDDIQVWDLGHAVMLEGDRAAVTSAYTVTTEPLLLTGSVLPISIEGPVLGLTLHPMEEVVDPGSPAAFEARAVGPGTLTYQWMKNGEEIEDDDRISGSRTPRLSISETVVEDSAFYSVLVESSECGEVESDGALLNLGTCIAVASVPPSAVSMRGGDPLILTIGVTGLLPLSHVWSFNGVDLEDDGRIIGSRSASLVIDPTLPGDAGSYRVRVTSPCGSYTRGVSVSFQPCAGIIAEPEDQQTYFGDTARFEVGASSHLALSYQWYRGPLALIDGARYSGARGPVFRILGAQSGDVGPYSCVVSCGFSQRTTRVAMLTLVPAGCLGDCDGDRRVTMTDVSAVLVYWLNDYRPGTGPGDANRDGVVNLRDLSMVLGRFGTVCP